MSDHRLLRGLRLLTKNEIQQVISNTLICTLLLFKVNKYHNQTLLTEIFSIIRYIAMFWNICMCSVAGSKFTAKKSSIYEKKQNGIIIL